MWSFIFFPNIPRRRQEGRRSEVVSGIVWTYTPLMGSDPFLGGFSSFVLLKVFSVSHPWSTIMVGGRIYFFFETFFPIVYKSSYDGFRGRLTNLLKIKGSQILIKFPFYSGSDFSQNQDVFRQIFLRDFPVWQRFIELKESFVSSSYKLFQRS